MLAMPLLNRFARLFTADLHAVLDRLEEPDVLLKQAVREMDEERAGMQTRANALKREIEVIATDLQAALTTLARLDEELDLCLANGHDELARGLVRRKLELEQRQHQLAGRRATVEQRERDLHATLADASARLDDMRQALAAVIDSSREPADGLAPSASASASISDDEIDIALLRERSRRSAS